MNGYNIESKSSDDAPFTHFRLLQISVAQVVVASAECAALYMSQRMCNRVTHIDHRTGHIPKGLRQVPCRLLLAIRLMIFTNWSTLCNRSDPLSPTLLRKIGGNKGITDLCLEAPLGREGCVRIRHYL